MSSKMSSKKKTNINKIKITPKKKLPTKMKKINNTGRQPPSRAQPSPRSPTKKTDKNKGGNADVVQRLQKLVQQKNTTIDQLTERINILAMKNKSLETKIERLQKSASSTVHSTNTNKKKASQVGVDSGPSQAGAAANLANLLGAHVKTKKKTQDKADAGGVSTGMSQKNAAAALGGLFAKKKAPPKASKSGVSSGMSQKGAAAALGGLLAKKKVAPPSNSSSKSSKKSKGKKGDYSQYTQLFKKYEMMMKLGINVHGAVGRMRQDGVEKPAIAAFEKKHNAYGDEDEEKIDPKSLGLKVKKEVSVSKGIKMKRFHWEQCHLKLIVGSIWQDLDESNIRYDRKHFELHFQVRQRKPVDEQKMHAAQAASGQVITFASKKRTQGVLIGLKNLNLENSQLRHVLHNMDETVMSVDTLAKLLEMAPTVDEQTEAEKKIMQEGTRKVADYGTVEQFFFSLYDFYNLHQRLKLWMFKQNFSEICDSLLDQYKTIGRACDKIRNNKNLRLLLTIILTFGNHMNSGTRKGQTYGFDLKILTGMTGVKSFDNTRSLLMYVYEFCDRKYPAAIRVLDELSDTLKAASSMEVETLKQAYQRIKENMKEMKNLITSDEIENYDMDDRFIIVLTKFHKKAAPKMKKFNMTVGNVMVSTKRVMKKFSYGSEDSPKTIESFFQIWWKFLQDFRASKEKLIQLEKERQKRIAKRKKLKDKEKKKKMHKQYSKNDKNEGDGMQKGSSLHREFEKRKKFEQMKEGLHGKLRGHVKQRSIFIANGGKLDDGKPINNTMRRLSTMYQTEQSQITAMEEARKKAAILKYNKFKLPDINSKGKSRNYQKWTNTSKQWDSKQPFNIPDSKPMMAPTRGRKQVGGKSSGGVQQSNGHSTVPPPPSGKPPPVHGQNVGGGQGGYGQNPQGNWTNQQQQLGYGSNPNLSYQQYQQGPVNNSYQQQQRANYGMQNKGYYYGNNKR